MLCKSFLTALTNVVRERILQEENIFYSKRTHSVGVLCTSFLTAGTNILAVVRAKMYTKKGTCSGASRSWGWVSKPFWWGAEWPYLYRMNEYRHMIN